MWIEVKKGAVKFEKWIITNKTLLFECEREQLYIEKSVRIK